MQNIKMPTTAEWTNAVTAGGWFVLVARVDFLAPMQRLISAGNAVAQTAGKVFQYRVDDVTPDIVYIRFAATPARIPFDGAHLNEWIEDRCLLGNDLYTPRDLLFDSYLAWCASREVTPSSISAWSKAFAVSGYETALKRIPERGNAQVPCFLGLALQPVPPPA